MRFVNLTPHALNLVYEDGSEAVEVSEGHATVESTPGALDVAVSEATGFPVYGPPIFGAVTGLPDPQEGVMYIVSGIVGSALAGTRDDVLVPGTSPADNPRRNEARQVTGVTRLNRA
jgi:hypothetical protein